MDMWVPHLKKKKKPNIGLASDREAEGRFVLFIFLYFPFISFSDSRVSDRQNSSG